MEVELKLSGDSTMKKCRVSSLNDEHVFANGFCPLCGNGKDKKFEIIGPASGVLVRRRDRYIAAAYCYACGQHIGYLAVTHGGSA